MNFLKNVIYINYNHCSKDLILLLKKKEMKIINKVLKKKCKIFYKY